LIAQWKNEIHKFFPEQKIRIWSAEEKRKKNFSLTYQPSEIVICSVTFFSRNTDKIHFYNFPYIIVDEIHKYISNIYYMYKDNKPIYNSGKRIYLTATLSYEEKFLYIVNINLCYKLYRQEYRCLSFENEIEKYKLYKDKIFREAILNHTIYIDQNFFKNISSFNIIRNNFKFDITNEEYQLFLLFLYFETKENLFQTISTFVTGIEFLEEKLLLSYHKYDILFEIFMIIIQFLENNNGIGTIFDYFRNNNLMNFLNDKNNWISSKMKELLTICNLFQDEKIIIFCVRNEMAILLNTFLDFYSQRKILFFSNAKKMENHSNMLEEFTNSENNIFLSTVNKSSVGLNLQRSRTVILYERYLMSETDVTQCIGRVTRIGQEYENIFVFE